MFLLTGFFFLPLSNMGSLIYKEISWIWESRYCVLPLSLLMIDSQCELSFFLKLSKWHVFGMITFCDIFSAKTPRICLRSKILSLVICHIELVLVFLVLTDQFLRSVCVNLPRLSKLSPWPLPPNQICLRSYSNMSKLVFFLLIYVYCFCDE